MSDLESQPSIISDVYSSKAIKFASYESQIPIVNSQYYSSECFGISFAGQDSLTKNNDGYSAVPYYLDVVDAQKPLLINQGGGSSDVTPPVITNFSPISGSTINNSNSISFKITDETLIGTISIWVIYGDGSSELIANDTTFTSNFSSSSATLTTPSGYNYIVLKNSGWSNSSVTINIKATDAAGNISSSNASYTVSDPVVPDTTPPTIGPYNPVSTSTILAANRIRVHISDDTSLGSVTVWAVFDNGRTELIASDDVFEPAYSTSSVVGVWPSITDYNILRDDGWLTATFSLYVKAIDSSGNIAQSSSNYNVTDPTGTATITKNYIMRGQDANCTELTYRVWKVTGTPDYTGSQYSDGYCGESLNLTNIIMVRTWDS